MRIVIDLDHTICVPDMSHTDSFMRYGLALPIKPMIERMNKWRARGDYIIIHTARRMVTHNGDHSKIEADIGRITRNWLKENKVPYDELILFKPYGDVYIDDKALNADDSEKLDNL